MSGVTVTGLDAAIARARSVPQQARYASSVALNQALRAASADMRAQMGRVFDRPTPYLVRNAVQITPSSSRAAGEVAGEIFVAAEGRDAPGKALRAEVLGGPRRAKRSELLLRSIGVLPQGQLTVPGRAAKLDQYGNITRGQILEVLAWFRAFPQRPAGAKNSWNNNLTDRGQASKRRGTRNRGGFEYFAVQRGDGSRLSPGVYKRQLGGARFVGPAMTGRPQAVLIFVPRTQYQQRLDFVRIAEQAINKQLPQAYGQALRRALDTAR
jgi:hypothetical protein